MSVMISERAHLPLDDLDNVQSVSVKEDSAKRGSHTTSRFSFLTLFVRDSVNVGCRMKRMIRYETLGMKRTGLRSVVGHFCKSRQMI